MASTAAHDAINSIDADKAKAQQSEKYKLGEQMVVEFLGKSYQLGVGLE